MKISKSIKKASIYSDIRATSNKLGYNLGQWRKIGRLVGKKSNKDIKNLFLFPQ